MKKSSADGRLRGGEGEASPMATFYFFSFSSVAITVSYLPQHLRALGLSGAQIGLLLCAYPLTNLLAPPLWGFLADRTRRGALLLSVTVLGSLLGFVPLLFATREATIAPWLLVAAFFTAPVTTLADSLTLERLRERTADYARVRAWGSVGFIAAATAFGFLYDGERGEPPPVIVAALVTVGLSFLASLRVRGRSAPQPPLRLREARFILADRRVRLLLAATSLHWLACSPFNLLFAVHLKDLGHAPAVAGMGIGLGVAAEVAMMAFFPRLARSVTAPRILGAAMAASALRWALVGLSTSAAPLVLLQAIHGFTFGAFYVAAVAYIEEIVPAELRATGQALFTSVTFGLGGIVGYLAIGPLYDLGFARFIFLGAAVLELVPAAVAFSLPAAGSDTRDTVLKSDAP